MLHNLANRKIITDKNKVKFSYTYNRLKGRIRKSRTQKGELEKAAQKSPS